MPEQAKIPDYLGKCEVLKVHDDGDLSIKCAGKKYVVTTEGEVFKEYDVEQCMLDELEKPSEEWQRMSREEKRGAFMKAITQCARGRNA